MEKLCTFYTRKNDGKHIGKSPKSIQKEKQKPSKLNTVSAPMRAPELAVPPDVDRQCARHPTSVRLADVDRKL